MNSSAITLKEDKVNPSIFIIIAAGVVSMTIANSVARIYADLAAAVEAELAKLPKDYSSKIGKVATISA